MEIVLFITIGYAAGAATFAPLWVKAKKIGTEADFCFHHLYSLVLTDVNKAAEHVKEVEAALRKAL